MIEDTPSVQIELYLRMRTGVRRLGAGCAVKKVPKSFVLSRCIVWKYNEIDTFVLLLLSKWTNDSSVSRLH